MTSHGAVAAKVRREKETFPERFCRVCLWRIVVRGQPSPCPRHSIPTKVEPVTATSSTT